MSVQVNAGTTFAVVGGKSYGGSSALTNYGLHVVDEETVAAGETAKQLDVGIAATSAIKALFMKFSGPCTFTIDSGIVVVTVAADDQLVIVGTMCTSLLNAISAGTAFENMLVTTSATPVTITIAVLVDPTI